MGWRVEGVAESAMWEVLDRRIRPTFLDTFSLRPVNLSRYDLENFRPREVEDLAAEDVLLSADKLVTLLGKRSIDGRR